MYLVEKYVSTQSGEPYRLFKFGVIRTKDGRKIELTPEYARTIKLPPFKPPIKLGSHADETPAGGHIVGLEIRDDGVYVVPEWNEQGMKAQKDGAYRYQSPEIIWHDGALATNEGVISGPLVVGDALLHNPYLGEDTAFYSVEEIKQENTMDENIQFPKSFWDKFVAPLIAKNQEVKEVEKVVQVVPEDYEATKIKLAEYEAERVKLQAEAERKTRVEKYESELKETKADPSLAEILADLAPEQAEAIAKQFRALSEQINVSNIEDENGSSASEGIDDPKGKFNALVLERSKEKGISYNSAFEVIKLEQPELFKAWAVKEK